MPNPTSIEGDPDLEVMAAPAVSSPNPTNTMSHPQLRTPAHVVEDGAVAAGTSDILKKKSAGGGGVPSSIKIASCPGGSLSGAFGTRLTPILPHSLGAVASTIGRFPPPTHITGSVPVAERLLLRGGGGGQLQQQPDDKGPPVRGGGSVIGTNHNNTAIPAHSSNTDAPLRTIVPTVAEPLQMRLVAAMRRAGITWEVLAGEYQRAVSGYSRLSSETLQRWALPKGDTTVHSRRGAAETEERGACESLAAAFIEDSTSLTQLVADHFHQQHHKDWPSGVVDFAAFCRASHLPLGDAAAWIDGGIGGSGMRRIVRSIGPQALSLLTHSAIQRRQALQRDSHEQRKHTELLRRKHDRSKVVASPERIREAGGGGVVVNSGSPRDLLFAIDEGRHKNTSNKKNTKNTAHAQFHSVAAAANVAPKAFKAIRQYKSRFGRSETTSLHGLGDDDEEVVVGGTVISNSLSAINNSLMSVTSVDGGSSAGMPTPTNYHYHSPSPTATTNTNTLAVVPRWKKMADARPPIPIRPDSSTLLQHKKKDYRHPTSLSSPSKGANINNNSTTTTHAPVRLTQDSRPEWYKDRQELEAVMRRRILSSESHVRNDVLVDAFFEPQGGNRAVAKDGGFPVMGLVAENIVSMRREKQRAAIYKKELGEDW